MTTERDVEDTRALLADALNRAGITTRPWWDADDDERGIASSLTALPAIQFNVTYTNDQMSIAFPTSVALALIALTEGAIEALGRTGTSRGDAIAMLREIVDQTPLQVDE